MTMTQQTNTRDIYQSVLKIVAFKIHLNLLLHKRMRENITLLLLLRMTSGS